MTFLTLSDINYLPKGLAMYLSIKDQHKGEFRLKYLCLDTKCFDTLKRLNLPEIDLYKLSDLEERDEFLMAAKSFPATHGRDKYAQYCWCLAPYFSHYILARSGRDSGFMAYVDADILFFHDPVQLWNDKPVGIHTHRFLGDYNEDHESGWFNVGVVTFNYCPVAVDITESWKNWLLNPNNQYCSKYGSCGDQKYLELFLKLWGWDNVCVIDKDMNVGHLAPWNYQNKVIHHPTMPWYIVHNRRTQPVVFYHFSRFVTDGIEYKAVNVGEQPTDDVNIKPYYDRYFEYIQKSYKMITNA